MLLVDDSDEQRSLYAAMLQRRREHAIAVLMKERLILKINAARHPTAGADLDSA